MHKPTAFPTVAIISLIVLVVAGPTLVALATAAVPLIAVSGFVAIVLRLVWFHTRRW